MQTAGRTVRLSKWDFTGGMMKANRIIQSLAAMAVATIGMGFPTFKKEFESTYPLKKDGKIMTASCGLCHVGKTKKLNPYGLDLKAAMQRENTKKLTGSVLKKVEGMDSDKDSVANLTEIQSDTLPGDPKSK